MRRLALVLLLLLAALALVAAGCGSDDDEPSAAVASTATSEEGEDGEEEEEAATPEEAVNEIAEIKLLLARAVTEVESGDRDKADTTVGDAYLEHFEHVEAPLGDRDHDLMEELEEAISTDLRDQIKDGDDVAEIRSSVDEIGERLDDAVEALQD